MEPHLSQDLYNLGTNSHAGKGTIIHMGQNAAKLRFPRAAAAAQLFLSAPESRLSMASTQTAFQPNHGFHQAVVTHRPHSTSPVPVEHKALRLHDVLEKEAKRMAQALHDEAGQLLAAVHLKLDVLDGKLPEGQRHCVGELKSLLDQMEEQLRRISHELRPTILDDLGLLPAVEFLRQGVAKRTGLSIVLEGSIRGRLHPSLETALYRIVHEALGNIANHACAKRVRIAFRMDDRIRCTVHDDGIGFNPAEIAGKCGRGLGLSAIRERVEDLSGTLSIQSSPGCGTKLSVSLPL
jgi:signal transduction histidine kinase